MQSEQHMFCVPGYEVVCVPREMLPVMCSNSSTQPLHFPSLLACTGDHPAQHWPVLHVSVEQRVGQSSSWKAGPPPQWHAGHHSATTVPPQCHHSAITVPSQCHHSASHHSATTVPPQCQPLQWHAGQWTEWHIGPTCECVRTRVPDLQHRARCSACHVAQCLALQHVGGCVGTAGRAVACPAVQ